MRRLGLCCCVALLVGCEKPKEQPAADTTMAAAPEPAMPAPISLADVAGSWTLRVMPEGSDTTLLTFELAADSAGWVFKFPNRKPVTVKVEASGDSILTEAGPYESVLRKGVQVTTTSVMRMVDGKLVGTTTAHYASKGADSVRSLRVEGTRAQ
jgi:hypothetical protein